MADSLTQLRTAWRVIVAKPKQIKRLILPPFLVVVALQAWVSVQTSGYVWPDLPQQVPVTTDLALRACLGLAVALMALLWHRSIYFGPRAPLTARLALRYWGQGTLLTLLAILPFVLPLALLTITPAGFAASVFVADAASLWLVICFGAVVTCAAGGTRLSWRAAWDGVNRTATTWLALGLAVLMQVQGWAVTALAELHGGAAFLLDRVIIFALIVTVLTLMARPKPA